MYHSLFGYQPKLGQQTSPSAHLCPLGLAFLGPFLWDTHFITYIWPVLSRGWSPSHYC
jgi:hypothetical protein